MSPPAFHFASLRVTPPPEGEARLALGRPGGGRLFPSLPFSPPKDTTMQPTRLFARGLLATLLAGSAFAAIAQDKVVLATNWRAQPGHGGF